MRSVNFYQKIKCPYCFLTAYWIFSCVAFGSDSNFHLADGYKLQINRIEREFSSYKVRAHALLQKKDAELASARDNDQVKALEEALKVKPATVPDFLGRHKNP